MQTVKAAGPPATPHRDHRTRHHAEPEQAARVLQEIRAARIHLLTDDFGTGYSSLSCLNRYPVSSLKLDKSFSEFAGERRDYAAVIQAIVTLTRNLEMQLIAEGVETLDQVQLLESMECDQVRGFYFDRPMPAAQAEQFLRSQSPDKKVA